jgi:steroid 5-alpha reductase family enzyme
MFWWCLLFTVGAVAVILGVTFAIGVAQRRHSVIDVAWGLGFVGIAVTSFVVSNGHGDDARRLLVTVLTAVWGVRLAAHIGMRLRGAGEDPRYEKLLSRVSGSRNVYAAKSIYLVQGVTMWFVSLPVQAAMFERGGIGVLGWLGAAVWLVGFGFEAVGDAQLTRFKADPANEGKVMDRGLWHYTRHPNYFGDACVWWGLFLIACDHWTGVLTILSPLLMTYFLARKTGKPLLERRMAQTRPGYADYVARTSGFFPLPPRE